MKPNVHEADSVDSHGEMLDMQRSPQWADCAQPEAGNRAVEVRDERIVDSDPCDPRSGDVLMSFIYDLFV